MPAGIEAGRLIDRFGAQAVYGRVLTVREMRAILTEESVERAYRGEQAAERTEEGPPGWARKNPALAALLARALKAHHGIQD